VHRPAERRSVHRRRTHGFFPGIVLRDLVLLWSRP
jgi:hypothetical protein